MIDFKRTNTESAKLAVLIDPDKTAEKNDLEDLCRKAEFAKVHYIFVGGSSVNHIDFKNCLAYLNDVTSIPKIIFPGGPTQIPEEADGFLLLSLISGRNPDYLIGHHVNSAFELKKLMCPIIPTGYILVDGGTNSAVSYISQTTPIPVSSPEIAVKTALAGEMLGLKALFVDAGSGAKNFPSAQLVNRIRSEVTLPIIVGGGIKSTAEIEELDKAGADVIVVGNKIEENVDFLLDIEEYVSSNF